MIKFKKVITTIFLLPLYFYQQAISPFKPRTCRYDPTCSAYSVEAIKVHGIFKGSYYSIKRILSCHPWGKSGYDPVPNKKKSNN